MCIVRFTGSVHRTLCIIAADVKRSLGLGRVLAWKQAILDLILVSCLPAPMQTGLRVEVSQLLV